MTSPKSAGALAAAWGVAALLLFGWTACPTVFFGDSGELIAAASTFGVAHPPGYPLYTAVGYLALALPWGEAAWRMNLLSAIFGAGTCATAGVVVLGWTGSRAAGSAAAWALAASASFWGVSTVAEVYTLHLLFTSSLLLGADRCGRAAGIPIARRWLLFVGLILGLGLGHRPTIVLALPAALWLAWPSTRPARRWRQLVVGLHGAGAATLVIGLPLLAFGSLLLRSRRNPVVNWGQPDDLAALWRHITTRTYDWYVVGPAGWLRGASWAEVGSILWVGFGFVGLPLAALGLAAALGSPVLLGTRGRSIGVGLLLLAVPTLLFGLSYGTEDVEVLFLPLSLVTALALGLGIAALAGISTAGAKLRAVGLTFVAIGCPLWLNAPTRDLHAFTAAREYGKDVLRSIPRRGLLFVQGDESFLLAYLTIVLGERPDVTIVDRWQGPFPNALSLPGSPRRAGESFEGFRMRREGELFARELSGSDPRPILFTTWPGYEAPPGLRFEPVGLLYHLRRAQAPPLADRPLWERYGEASVTSQVQSIGHPFGRTLAATYPLMRGERARFERDPRRAIQEFERASALAGPSEAIHNYLGTLYGQWGDYPRAIRELELAVRIKPRSFRAWNNLALARSLSGDAAGARKAWQRSLDIQPGQPEVRARLGGAG